MYFPEMIKAIDLKKEERRLEHVQFAAEAHVRKAKAAPVAPPPPLSGAQKTLEEAENLYQDHDRIARPTAHPPGGRRHRSRPRHRRLPAGPDVPADHGVPHGAHRPGGP